MDFTTHKVSMRVFALHFPKTKPIPNKTQMKALQGFQVIHSLQNIELKLASSIASEEFKGIN